jgi:acid stress-induced BolA-like protein IbaG/YrbA
VCYVQQQMLNAAELRRRLEAALPGAEVRLIDTTGTGDHFEATVIAAAFDGLSLVKQHQLVYAPLRDVLATGELHALALTTYTPAAWREQQTT